MKYIYIIDQGHRKSTPGKSANGLYEYEFNDDVGNMLENELKDYGQVYFTIDTPEHPYDEKTAQGRSKNLNYRTSKANKIYWDAVKKYGKDGFKVVFVSIHANAFSNPSVSGYEIFTYKFGTNSHELAKSIHRESQLVLGVGTSINDRKVKEGNFAVLRNTVMDAVLIEHEFYTNLDAVKKLKDSNFRKLCAKHIAKGVLSFVGLEYKEKTEAKPVERPMNSEIYRVRKVWEDSKSQMGAYSNLDNAILLADQLALNVYDSKGTQVYPKKEVFELIIYTRLIKKGIKGNDVELLQIYLNKLGFNSGKPDGVAGANTDKAIKLFQNAYGLTVDGLAGRATIDMINKLIQTDNVVVKPNPQPIPSPNNKKSKYYKIGDAHIIETTPDNIEIAILGNALQDAKRYGVNGALYDTKTAPVTSPESCVFIAMNDGKPLSNNAQFNGWNAPPRATLIYHTNKKIGFRQLQNINPIKDNTIWAIGGYMVKPYMDFTNEKIPSSVNYKTAHTYLGYRGNKIFMIVKPNHMIRDIVPLANQLELEGCIVLDGGQSSQLNHPDGNYRSSRVINTAVILREM